MKNLVSTIEVSNGKSGDAQFYWRNMNEYRNMSEAISATVEASMSAAEAMLRTVAGKGGDLTATLTASKDGKVDRPIVLTGIQDADLRKAQREFYKAADRVLKASEEHGKKKDG